MTAACLFEFVKLDLMPYNIYILIAFPFAEDDSIVVIHDTTSGQASSSTSAGNASTMVRFGYATPLILSCSLFTFRSRALIYLICVIQ